MPKRKVKKVPEPLPPEPVMDIKLERISDGLCSACGENVLNLYDHPLLHVPVCKVCVFFYTSGEFTIEDGYEMYCRWCGEGKGQLICCDTCPKAFCSGCIERNFGAVELKRLSELSDRWNCFLCSPQRLYDLQRIKGWRTVNFDESQVNPELKAKQKKGLICMDISRGREKFELPVYNNVDKAGPPLDFVYVTKHVPGENVVLSNNPSFISCCTCTDNCRDPNRCECLKSMGGFAYDKNGILLNNRSSVGVYECNERCSCHVKRCKNRLIGNGPTLRLEVFRCPNPDKGWGVRCTQNIPPGTYIADYIGEVLSEKSAEHRGLVLGDEYLFTLDSWGRSQACTRLTELGMKRSLISIPRQVDMDVSVMNEESIKEYIDPALFKLLSEKGTIKRLKEEMQKKKAKVEETGKLPIGSPIPKAPASKVHHNRKPTTTALENSSSSTVHTVTDYKSGKPEVPWAFEQLHLRLSDWNEARNVLADREISALEKSNETFIIDARYEQIHCCINFFNHFLL